MGNLKSQTENFGAKTLGKICAITNLVENYNHATTTQQLGLGNIVDFGVSLPVYTGYGTLIPIGYTIGNELYESHTGVTFRSAMNECWTLWDWFE